MNVDRSSSSRGRSQKRRVCGSCHRRKTRRWTEEAI